MRKTSKVVVALAVLVIVTYCVQLPSVKANSPHVPGIIFHQSLVMQTTDIPTVFTVIAPSDGADYRVSLYANIVSGPTSGATVVNFDDGVVPQPVSICAIALAAQSSKTCLVHVAPNAIATVSTINTQNTGLVVYNLYVTVEEL